MQTSRGGDLHHYPDHSRASGSRPRTPEEAGRGPALACRVDRSEDVDRLKRE